MMFRASEKHQKPSVRLTVPNTEVDVSATRKRVPRTRAMGGEDLGDQYQRSKRGPPISVIQNAPARAMETQSFTELFL